MHFQGTVKIQAPREKVWDFLTDPKRVSKSAPGLESVCAKLCRAARALGAY